MTYKTGTDFSGTGALDQAMMRLGLQQDKKFACDNDKYARQSYITNYGEPEYYPEDVYDRKIPEHPLDIYVTTPPCQGFSIAGKREGSILFYNSHEFIQKNNPRYFIFENVKGLLSHDKPKNSKEKYGRTFNTWITLLGGKSVNGNPIMFPHKDSIPYHIYFKVINATEHNIPQNRERVFIVGIRDDVDNDFRWPKSVPLTKRLKDVLEDDVDKKYFLSDNAIEYFLKNSEKQQDAGNGFKFSPLCEKDLAKSITTKSGERMDDNFIKVKSATKCGYEVAEPGDSINLSVPNSETRRGRVGKEVANTLDTACNQGVLIQKEYTKGNSQGARVYETNGVSCTITAGGGGMGGKTGLYEVGFRIRRLTPREAFRLMDYPDTFLIKVSDTQAYKQAGNSVCVGVYVAILSKLLKLK